MVESQNNLIYAVVSIYESLKHVLIIINFYKVIFFHNKSNDYMNESVQHS